MQEVTRTLLRNYYKALNNQEWHALPGLLADEVIYEINQGRCQVGKPAFAELIRHRNSCYREYITDIHIMVNEDGSRAAVEYAVLGTHVIDGQDWSATEHSARLSGGDFFEIRDGAITRISSWRNCNLRDWIAEITSGDASVAD